MRVAWLVMASACSFSTTIGTGDGEAIDAPGIDDGRIGDVAHVPAAVEDAFAATASVTIGNATIQTRSAGTAPMIDVALSTGASLTSSPQDDSSGRELAILEVGDLTVTGTLLVRGTRPLVIIARGSITVTGAIDGSAVKGVPGAGGYDPKAGPGKGGNGADDAASFDDSGGGGGGFGTAGSEGQASGPTAAGSAGASYGMDLLRLEGGSGGGDMSPSCPNNVAGAGGGAIQLYARGAITIDGVVMVNGGGGDGGLVCPSLGLGTSGAGGGSGGAIYVQAASVTGSGLLLAQGGAGGGGSDFNNSTPGGDGANGSAMIAAALGGTGPGTGIGGEVNAGANGGFRDAPPSTHVALSGANFGNGGGGGGGVGRIVIRAATSTVATSPTPATLAP